MKDRIKQLMESQHMTQQNFAEYLGVSSATLSSLFTGRTQATLNHVNAIKKRFPTINLDWLMYGRGQMFSDAPLAQGDHSSVIPSSADHLVEPAIDFGSDFVDTNPTRPSVQDPASVFPSSTKREINAVKIIDKPQRRITEIRVFYDDQTWETFVPKK